MLYYHMYAEGKSVPEGIDQHGPAQTEGPRPEIRYFSCY